MPEATMLVLDNSEYMRNGDFIPTRWGAQTDATTIVFDAKTQSNPENMIGVMTMAGKSPRVLSTFTTDFGRLLQSMHTSHISGYSDVFTGINIAQLALKHRPEKIHTQRIIVFIGSPIKNTEEELAALGKRLRKNNVALDVINFGEDVENESKLQKLVESANSGENSHLVTVSSRTALLSDMILSSPILQDGGASNAGPSALAGGQEFEFGVDPDMDPELAMALRMSLQEEQARQRAAEGASATSAPEPTRPESSTASDAPSARPNEPSRSSTLLPATSATGGSSNDYLHPVQSLLPRGTDALGTGVGLDSEEAMLQQALALSRGGMPDEDVEMSSSEHPSRGSDAVVPGEASSREREEDAEVEEDEEMTEEEAIARAIEMSLQGEGSTRDEKS